MVEWGAGTRSVMEAPVSRLKKGNVDSHILAWNAECIFMLPVLAAPFFIPNTTGGSTILLAQQLSDKRSLPVPTWCDTERPGFDTHNLVGEGQKGWIFSFIERSENWTGGLLFSKLCLSPEGEDPSFQVLHVPLADKDHQSGFSCTGGWGTEDLT